MKRKLLSVFICSIMMFPFPVMALETEDDLSQYSYRISDDPNFKDGVMSSPDGYEGNFREIENNDNDSYQLARGSGYDLRWGYESGKKVMYDGNGTRFGYG